MIVTPVKTKKVVIGDNLEKILKASITKLEENSVVVITSKIVSITEGSIAPLTENKDELVAKEADTYFVNPAWGKEKTLLTIKDNIVMFWAGIDESNSQNAYALLPKNPFKSAEAIWQFLRKTYHINNLGVIIADSTCIPLRTGSVSVGLGWCGFLPIKNYIGSKDVFGREMKYTQVSLVDTLAIAAEATMGEGAEQQPIALISDIPTISFVARAPTNEEIASVSYPVDKDIFAPLIQAVTWEKGGLK